MMRQIANSIDINHHQFLMFLIFSSFSCHNNPFNGRIIPYA